MAIQAVTAFAAQYKAYQDRDQKSIDGIKGDEATQAALIEKLQAGQVGDKWTVEDQAILDEVQALAESKTKALEALDGNLPPVVPVLPVTPVDPNFPPAIDPNAPGETSTVDPLDPNLTPDQIGKLTPSQVDARNTALGQNANLSPEQVQQLNPEQLARRNELANRRNR